MTKKSNRVFREGYPVLLLCTLLLLSWKSSGQGPETKDFGIPWNNAQVEAALTFESNDPNLLAAANICEAPKGEAIGRTKRIPDSYGMKIQGNESRPYQRDRIASAR